MEIRKNNTVKSITKNIRVSPRKLALVASMIANMPVHQALLQLQFSRKRVASIVRKNLVSAIANAEHNHGFDVDNLVVHRAFVGKAMVLKRVMPRARGKAAKVQKYFSHLYIEVTEEVVKG